MKPRIKRLLFCLLGIVMLSVSQTEIYAQIINPSHQSGRYSEPFYLKLNRDFDHRYTTDGSTPSPNSHVFPDSMLIGYSQSRNTFCLIPTNAIEYNEKYWRNSEFGWRSPQEELEKLHTLRIVGFVDGRRVTEELSLVYQIDDTIHDLPIVSVITDSMNLFGNEIGIYVPGINYNPDNPDWSGNYFMKGDTWERPAFFNYIDESGQSLLNQKIGIRIHGGGTRGAPQKTLRLYAKSDFADGRFDLAFFGSDEPQSYKRLLLRSGMCHWYERNTLFQDEFLQSLIGDFYPDFDLQNSRPAEMFLNGEQWGLVAIKERIDEYYLAAHHNLNVAKIELITPTVDRVEGFDRILYFCEHNNLSDNSNYSQIEEWMEIQNFARYILLEMFLANDDWPGNNSKAWQSESYDNLWRWILYDLDAALGNSEEESIKHVADSDTPIGNIFLSLIQNESFINLLWDEWIRMRDNLFTPENMGPKLESFVRQYEPGVEGQVIRWQNPASISIWENNINEMYSFLLERPAIFDQQFMDFLNWDETTPLNPFIPKDYWRIYPNPVSDIVNIEAESYYQANWQVQLINVQGKVLLQQSLSNKELQLQMTSYPPGIYYIRITSNVYKANHKIIKY